MSRLFTEVILFEYETGSQPCDLAPVCICDVFSTDFFAGSNIGENCPALLRYTSVPLRLPTYLPSFDIGDFHAIIKSADETAFVIILGATADCGGQHVCSYGALIGTARPLNDLDFYAISDRKPVFVPLHRHINGYFYPPVCKA